MERKNLKPQTRRYNLAAVDKLATEYQLSKTFIRQCLNGSRTSLTAIRINSEYKDLVKKLDEALNNN